MDLAYAAADFAMCRAGAMTCAELTAVGLPAAYVPLPIGNGEQRLNAVPIVQGGGGMLVDDAELTPDWIRDALMPVLVDIDQVAQMSENAAGSAAGRRSLARRGDLDVIEGKGRGPGTRAKSLIEPAEPVPAIASGGCTSSASAGRACPASRECWPAGSASPVATRCPRPCSTTCTRRAPGVPRARGRQPRRPRPGGHPGAVQRDPRGQPGAGRGDTVGPAGHAPGRGAGLGHGRTPGDRGGRHPGRPPRRRC